MDNQFINSLSSYLAAVALTILLATGCVAQGARTFVIEGADFLIESFAPGKGAEWGLDHDALLALQPGLVHVSITPFGQDGPKSGWAATDLIATAASGFLYLSGESERSRAGVELVLPERVVHR